MLWFTHSPDLQMPEALSQTGQNRYFLPLHAVWCQPFSLNSFLLCSCSLMKRCLILFPRMHWEMSSLVNRLPLTTCGDPERQWSHSHVNNNSKNIEVSSLKNFKGYFKLNFWSQWLLGRFIGHQCVYQIFILSLLCLAPRLLHCFSVTCGYSGPREGNVIQTLG